MAYEYPEIQGSMTSWANIKVASEIHDGETFITRDYSAIDWDHALEVAAVPGTGPMPVGVADGAYTANGSMTMYARRALDFQKALMASKPGVGFMRIFFDLQLSWEPLEGDGEIITVKLVGCRIMSEAGKNAPGPDGAALEFPLFVTRVDKFHPDGTLIRAV